MTPPADELARLRAENARLRDRVEALEQAVFARDRLGSSVEARPQARTLLAMLTRGDVVTVEQALAGLEARHPSPDGRTYDSVHQAARVLRNALRPLGVDLRCVRGVGYWIPPEGKHALRELRARGDRAATGGSDADVY